MKTQSELGWAAGAVDGEGCIAIRTSRSVRSQRLQYGLYVAVSNTDPRMPSRLAEMFGGNVVLKDARHRQRPIYEWRVFSSKAALILQELRPYLVIKGEQADIAIAFAATLKRTGAHSQEVREAREQMRRKISVLKTEAI